MDVTMPQLGETVTEGTITRWFKAVGDRVAADEPLFEVSTDKVDSEVPAPAGGVLSEILVAEGDTVVSRAAVDEVVAASRNDGVVLAACVDRVFPATATNPVVVGTSHQAVGPGTAPEA